MAGRRDLQPGARENPRQMLPCFTLRDIVGPRLEQMQLAPRCRNQNRNVLGAQQMTFSKCGTQVLTENFSDEISVRFTTVDREGFHLREAAPLIRRSAPPSPDGRRTE